MRTPVEVALRGTGLDLCPIVALSSSSAAGLGLLGLLKPKQQLVLGQRLRPPAEAMALQFLDDLFKP